MAHAEVCVICERTGKYEDDYGKKKKCHGCSGFGWITVIDGNEYQPPVTFTGVPFSWTNPTSDYSGNVLDVNLTTSIDFKDTTAGGSSLIDFSLSEKDKMK